MELKKKDVLQKFNNVIEIGYCKAQHLLSYKKRLGYVTSRTYGWRADVYYIDDHTVLVTGYAPFGNVSPSYELLEKYEKQAVQTCYGQYDYETKSNTTDILLKRFINELLKDKKMLNIKQTKKEIKRNDLRYKIDFELYKMLYDVYGSGYKFDYMLDKDTADYLGRVLFFNDILELHGITVACKDEERFKWLYTYFENVRIKKGKINTKSYYMLDYAGNYDLFKKTVAQYDKTQYKIGTDHFYHYRLHISDFIKEPHKTMRYIKAFKNNDVDVILEYMKEYKKRWSTSL